MQSDSSEAVKDLLVAVSKTLVHNRVEQLVIDKLVQNVLIDFTDAAIETTLGPLVKVAFKLFEIQDKINWQDKLSNEVKLLLQSDFQAAVREANAVIGQSFKSESDKALKKQRLNHCYNLLISSSAKINTDDEQNLILIYRGLVSLELEAVETASSHITELSSNVDRQLKSLHEQAKNATAKMVEYDNVIYKTGYSFELGFHDHYLLTANRLENLNKKIALLMPISEFAYNYLNGNERR